MDTINEINNKLINLNYLLDRKIEILEDVLVISKSQFDVYNSKDDENKNLFLSNSIEEKQKLINELIQIDDMFFRIFKEFSGELNKYKSNFKDDILSMKEKIKHVTRIDLDIKFQEAKNKSRLLTFEQLSNSSVKNSNMLKTGKSSLMEKYKQNSDF